MIKELCLPEKRWHHFLQQFGIKLVHSTSYYAQAIGKTEATKKILINIIKKNLEDHPKK